MQKFVQQNNLAWFHRLGKYFPFVLWINSSWLFPFKCLCFLKNYKFQDFLGEKFLGEYRTNYYCSNCSQFFAAWVYISWISHKVTASAAKTLRFMYDTTEIKGLGESSSSHLPEMVFQSVVYPVNLFSIEFQIKLNNIEIIEIVYSGFWTKILRYVK